MELACRGYLAEPSAPANPSNWPVPYDAAFAEPMRSAIEKVLKACLTFAVTSARQGP
jgi:formiminoglutamase